MNSLVQDKVANLNSDIYIETEQDPVGANPKASAKAHDAVKSGTLYSANSI